MSEFVFELAGEECDPILREIMRNTPLEGEISLSFQREPSYFGALRAEGRRSQVIVGKVLKTGEIAGFGTCSIRQLFVNGEPCETGYLNNLRLLAPYRRGTLLARGFAFFQALQRQGHVKLYLASIMADNHHAIKVLTGKRAGLPAFQECGSYHTCVVSLSGKRRRLKGAPVIRKGTPDMTGEILDFVRRTGSQKQFYPVLTEDDIMSPLPLPGISADDFYVAYTRGRMVGVMARWDQSSFRQIVISGYGRRLRAVRPLCNLYAKLRGLPTLPGPSSWLRHFYVSFVAIEHNDADLFRDLLTALYNDHLNSGYSVFIAGFHSEDPLGEVLREFPHLLLKSRLYVVFFSDGEDMAKSLDKGRIPYFEVGML